MKPITLALLCFILAACGSRTSPHPSDLAMEENFTLNESNFKELYNLFEKSGKRVIRLGDDPAFDVKMKAVGIKMIHYRGQKKDYMQFSVSSTGMATGGSGKSYVWTPRNLASWLVPDTEEFAKENRDFVVYRKLLNEWYIRREHDG